MTAAIQFVIDVLSLGGAYALMALGLVIVYGILRLVNFAYGELIMVAGYTLFLIGGSPVPWLSHGRGRGARGDRDRPHRLRRVPAGAREVGDRGADHLVRLLDAAAERRAAADLAAAAQRAAAWSSPTPSGSPAWSHRCATCSRS